MKCPRLLLALLLPLLAGIVFVLLVSFHPPHVETSLYGLLNAEDLARIPEFLRNQSSQVIDVVVSAPSETKAREIVTALEARYPRAEQDRASLLKFISQERAGLMSPENAELLQTEDGRAKIARRAQRALYASPVPPLLGYEADPFLLTESFLKSLSWNATCIKTNGVVRMLTRFQAALPELEATVRARTDRDCTVQFCGPAAHTARATARSRVESGVLTVLSLVFILALAACVFHSFRFLPWFCGSFIVSALAGASAVMACFSDLHVMSFILGTTVLGLVVDYSFHALLSSGDQRKAFIKNLLASCLTTLVSLTPLVLSPIPLLRQAAVFLGVALVAAALYVLLAYPVAHVVPTCSALPSRPHPLLTGLLLVLVVVLCAATPFVRFQTDVTSLYRPPADLQAAEAVRAEFGSFDFSKLPSLHTRLVRNAYVRALYEEQGPKLAQALGCAQLIAPADPTFNFMSPQALLNRMLARWTSLTEWSLLYACVALLVLLVFLFRLEAIRLIFPSLQALVGVAGLLSLCHIPVTLFHLLAGFLLLGMSLDYTIFLHRGGSAVLKPALASLLTSLVGFGALAFVSFPMVSAFGCVLGVGLPLAFILAWVTRPEIASASSVEKGASPLGLEILWLFYRLLGLRALHFFAVCVGQVIWLCSPAVRKASPSCRKLKNFTRSLADKLVVMADGPDVPRVALEDSVDAQAFLSDVQSHRGVFVLSSHIGAIEVLVALGKTDITFHAWMDLARTQVFTRFYLRHAHRALVKIHPISDLNMGSVFEAGEWIDAGDCLLMAGDRGDGAFHFAHAFDHPVYFVACLAEGAGYRAFVKRLPTDVASMKSAYAACVQSLSTRYPEQVYDWN